MKLFDNEYVTISIDETVPCLEWIGKKFIPSEPFRISESKSLEFYLKYRYQYPKMQWFVDARSIGPVPQEDTQWVIDEILPKFAANGLKKEAFVLPKSAISKLSVKRYQAEAKGNTIEIRFFHSVESAKKWLTE